MGSSDLHATKDKQLGRLEAKCAQSLKGIIEAGLHLVSASDGQSISGQASVAK